MVRCYNPRPDPDVSADVSIIEESGMTQVQVASKLGIHQSRISDLMRGKIDRFSVDILVNLLARAGRHVSVQVEK